MTKQIAPFLRRARAYIERRTGARLPLPGLTDKALHALQMFPSDPDQLRQSELYKSWWYYNVELLPGVITKGIYPESLPMLPRVLVNRCEVAGTDCLDVGSMEAIVPALLARRGARRVVAADAIDHCGEKMAAVRHYYDVDFETKRVGLMYDLQEKFPRQGFDLINLSGLLYHVFSPMLVIAGVRPLLKKNGLIIISTGVIFDDSFTMEFNNAGRIQEDANTFWYLSVPLMDYMLRYLKLAPIDCVYLRHAEVEDAPARLRFEKSSGYLSVVCRATDEVLPTPDDQWMAFSASQSWEHIELPHWDIAERQKASKIEYTGNRSRSFFRPDVPAMDLWEAVNSMDPYNTALGSGDTHTLRLSDQ